MDMLPSQFAKNILLIMEGFDNEKSQCSHIRN